jgi:hypothetical protein
MTERYELRLFAQYRDLVENLLPAPPVVSGGIVVLRGEVGDAVFSRLAEVECDLQKFGLAGTCAGWKIKRSYTQEELQRGELFLIKPPFTHLSAEEYGTLYTESETCRQVSFDFELIDPSGSQIRTVPRLVPCGLCSKQATTLHLPLSRLPRSRDLVMLWGGEIVLSERFYSLLTSRAYPGSEFRPVVGRGKKRYASESNYRRGPCQLIVYSSPVEVSKECRFGSNPFDFESYGSYRCPSGEIAGLNLLSTLKVVRSTWDGSDISRTRIYVGGRQGLFRPHQLLLVSKRVFHAMRGAAIKGFDYEVAELV